MHMCVCVGGGGVWVCTRSCVCVCVYTCLYVCLTLTLMIQDSGPSSHRTMFRFSKLKMTCLGGMGMVPIRSLL